MNDTTRKPGAIDAAIKTLTDEKPATQAPAAPKPAAPVTPVAAAATPAAPAKPREVRALPLPAFTLMHSADGSFGQIWGATVPSSYSWDDVLEPSFWANKADVMKADDFIWVRDEKRSYLALLLVRSLWTVGRGVPANRALVQVLQRHDLEGVAETLDLSGFAISYQGRDKKWCVVNGAGVIVDEGFAAPEDAGLARRQRAQKQHVKAA